MSWLGKLFAKVVPSSSNYDEAIRAIHDGDITKLESLLNQNPPLIRISYCISGSLLHNAAYYGQVEIAKMLIAKGADVNDASTRDTETPLHFAATGGQLEMIKLLIEHGANINALCDQNTHSALDRALWAKGGANKDIIRYLIANGAKHSKIHAASVLGDITLAEEAISSGDDINSQDLSGETPMHWAVKSGNAAKSMIDFLIGRGANVEGRSHKGPTPLYIAASDGNQAAVEALLAHGANVNAEGAFGGRPLTAAQSSGHREVSELLLKHGADSNVADAFGGTPLHNALADNDIEALKDLLNRKCDPNAMSSLVPILAPDGKRMWRMVPKNSFAPLHIAAERGYLEAAELLIEYGADVNKQTPQGETPLHSAASEGQAEVASLLLSKGADPTIKNRKKKTPLDLALKAGKEDVVAVIREWKQGM